MRAEFLVSMGLMGGAKVGWQKEATVLLGSNYKRVVEIYCYVIGSLDELVGQ